MLAILPFAHSLLQHAIRSGDCVLDGTAGNGHDTLLLARCVGDSGTVYAFDIQETALAATRQRLQQADMLRQVRLIHAGHQRLSEFVRRPLAAAVFNFGYLPHGDKTITTQAETSIQAVAQTLNLLKTGGIAVLVLYHGHAAGKTEAQALLDYAAKLPQQQFKVLQYQFINQQNSPPFILAIEKTGLT
ncbi:class I SAM-dependent methyltransferase [Neisseria sp. ZJ106]|uniref:Class I SAM-dependent methyltransferase n=1 Tax=Neisseria lisongii TaxID=2912188 RepID=A0ABY7RI93_9NEIS|nr:class I SAM-dependent methyltransferase [Neisseria lisongii]MCF7521761.1 class I SAM-dependent methyltransferase [Neisseria lisongii]WCL71002.1 class I SAM-dependent methyltransferase [Neisseria lisongii]